MVAPPAMAFSNDDQLGPPPAGPGPLVVVRERDVLLDGKLIDGPLPPGGVAPKLPWLEAGLEERSSKDRHGIDCWFHVAYFAPVTLVARAFAAAALPCRREIAVAVAGRWVPVSVDPYLLHPPWPMTPARILHIQVDDNVAKLRWSKRVAMPVRIYGDIPDGNPRIVARPPDFSQAWPELAKAVSQELAGNSSGYRIAVYYSLGRGVAHRDLNSVLTAVAAEATSLFEGSPTLSVSFRNPDLPEYEDELPIMPWKASQYAAESDPRVFKVHKVVGSQYFKLWRCYQDVLRTNPAARGKAMLRFVVQADGAGPERTVTLEGDLPPTLSSCLEKILGELRFGPLGGSALMVTYPMLFPPR